MKACAQVLHCVEAACTTSMLLKILMASASRRAKALIHRLSVQEAFYNMYETCSLRSSAERHNSMNLYGSIKLESIAHRRHILYGYSSLWRVNYLSQIAPRMALKCAVEGRTWNEERPGKVSKWDRPERMRCNWFQMWWGKPRSPEKSRAHRSGNGSGMELYENYN